MKLLLFDWTHALDNLIDIVIAYILAVPIGWWWERARHNSGIRTFPLVSVASCGYILLSRSFLGPDGHNLDRVVQGLVTGIGFIGGGAIFKEGLTVRGTSTAASIWTVGAVGAAIGCGAYDIGILLALVNVVTLRLLTPLKETLDKGEPERELE
jgi:putative Mg2+ transporter-C (MgtC) family protein